MPEVMSACVVVETDDQVLESSLMIFGVESTHSAWGYPHAVVSTPSLIIIAKVEQVLGRVLAVDQRTVEPVRT